MLLLVDGLAIGLLAAQFYLRVLGNQNRKHEVGSVASVGAPGISTEKFGAVVGQAVPDETDRIAPTYWPQRCKNQGLE